MWAEYFSCGNESEMRRTWRKNTAGRWRRLRRDYAAAYKVPVCSSSYFNWTPFYMHIQLTICTPTSDLRKIQHAQYVPERNWCPRRGGSETTSAWNTISVCSSWILHSLCPAAAPWTGCLTNSMRQSLRTICTCQFTAYRTRTSTEQVSLNKYKYPQPQ